MFRGKITVVLAMAIVTIMQISRKDIVQARRIGHSLIVNRPTMTMSNGSTYYYPRLVDDDWNTCQNWSSAPPEANINLPRTQIGIIEIIMLGYNSRFLQSDEVQLRQFRQTNFSSCSGQGSQTVFYFDCGNQNGLQLVISIASRNQLSLCEIRVFVANDLPNCTNPSVCGPGQCTIGALRDTCTCPPSVHGTYCDIGNCSSNPCQNNAICHDSPHSYRCECPSQYTGFNCEMQDFCYSDPCQGNGTCTTNSTGYSCSCMRDYIGLHCEHFRACDSNPCQHNASCFVRPGAIRHECLCMPPDYYTGLSCELIDYCHSSPCANNGTCVFLGADQYACQCQQMYGGTHCQDNVTASSDWCSSNPCQNGGVCNLLVGDIYACQCQQMYSGTHCQDDVTASWGAGQPGGTGQPDGAGPARGAGQPDGAGPAGGAGQPDGAGPGATATPAAPESGSSGAGLVAGISVAILVLSAVGIGAAVLIHRRRQTAEPAAKEKAAKTGESKPDESKEGKEGEGKEGEGKKGERKKGEGKEGEGKRKTGAGETEAKAPSSKK